MNELINNDRIAKIFGIKLEEYREGYAKTSMIIREDFLNAYNIAHGAAIYALADVSFAIACNSHGIKAIALSMNINYRRPVTIGKKVIAEAEEVSKGRTTALYNIKVIDEEGKIIALAIGLAYFSQ
ncbi:MAG: phenylacetic acid degradation protein [Candidatus Methanomethylicota archaeon]|uniref:Hotdog fold thioesterase n=1 Tax=Thermoproteota archaeon TaxID=2056631 RepID=A0A523BE34_9CREN|nr:hotdog fold thioesterase [Candidatus Verstraetearchaeota archaeon]RZN56547.1 MAG: hotdog fold thioesterase [Candidatus Verstraetearchaeota archaeon]TDA38720.1 MAG: phenylacetic acid degradation protein [Candidatus Verstraetearchaeota archaeon]